MCTILFAWQWHPGVPVVLAANRDELVDRPSEPPAQLEVDPSLWGGRDQLAGGTWLAVDPRGRLCAVTNRHPGGRLPDKDADRRSRGSIPTRVLRTGTNDRSAIDTLCGFEAHQFNPVNALYLSPSSAYWVGLDDEGGHRSAALSPGVHVLTEQDPDDPFSAKTSALLKQAADIAYVAQSTTELVDGFRTLLASHERTGLGPETAPCIHEERFGTVSSATVVVTSDGVSFEHAEGHPCVTPFQPVPLIP